MKTFAERLVFFRQNHLGLSQHGFCEMCDKVEKKAISQQNISQWENGEGKPNLKKMGVIAKAFPMLNRDWIEIGFGDMLKSSSFSKIEYAFEKAESNIEEKIKELEEQEMKSKEALITIREQLLNLYRRKQGRLL